VRGYTDNHEGPLWTVSGCIPAQHVANFLSRPHSRPYSNNVHCSPDITTDRVLNFTVFLSGQAGLSGGFQMRAGPGLAAFPAGLAAFLGGLSLNRIFCSKDSLLFTKKVSKVRNTISNSIIVALLLPYFIHQSDQGLCRPMQAF